MTEPCAITCAAHSYERIDLASSNVMSSCHLSQEFFLLRAFLCCFGRNVAEFSKGVNSTPSCSI